MPAHRAERLLRRLDTTPVSGVGGVSYCSSLSTFKIRHHIIELLQQSAQLAPAIGLSLIAAKSCHWLAPGEPRSCRGRNLPPPMRRPLTPRNRRTRSIEKRWDLLTQSV